MKTYDSYRLLITALSPVHIGTGDSYEPTNYVIEDDTLHEFDIGELMELLPKSDKDSLLKVVDRRADDNMIKAVQRFFYERRSWLIARARNRIPVLQGVSDLYRERVGQTAQHEESGRQIISQLAIDRTGFNPVSRMPVLFGSSLKGAIRTALLNSVNRGKPAQERKGLHDFQGRLFRYQDQRLFLECDPLRLVQIGDTTWHGEEGLPASEVRLAVNRKKTPVMDERGNLRPSQAEQRGLYQILECMPAPRYRLLDAQLNIQNVGQLDKAGKLPDSSLRFDIGCIARACNDFYRLILIEENRVLTGRGLLDEKWHIDIDRLLNGEVGQRMDRGEVFLLRVGRHSGAESVTLRGVRRIKIMKAKGQPTEEAPSAKTVWLAAGDPAQQNDMLPFGWLLVEIFPADHRGAKECDVLKSLCERYLGSARNWAVRQSNLARERMRQQAEQEARQLREQEAAKLKAAEQAKLAALSDEQRAIEDLRKIYEADKAANRKEQQGELASRRVGLLRQAKAWESGEMRREAADLIEETTHWIPWPKQKRAERSRELEELRNK